jgi:ATP-binding cassette subfamily C exporter for protease/lipase
LARALYGEPEFIVLDEPNASLDEEGDAALAKALLQAKQRRTTVVVMTHRNSILGIADKLLVMRDGAQQLFGPRDEVIAKIREASAKAPAAKA